MKQIVCVQQKARNVYAVKYITSVNIVKTEYGFRITPSSSGSSFNIGAEGKFILRNISGTILSLHDRVRGWANFMLVRPTVNQIFHKITFDDGSEITYVKQKVNGGDDRCFFNSSINLEIDGLKIDYVSFDMLEGSITTDKLEFTSEWMGASKVTTTIDNPTTIPFSIGDYIVYRGAEYYLRNIPTVKKVSSQRYVYENVVFEGVEGELANCNMLDTVLNGDTTTQYTMMPTWSVFCNDVIEFAERIKANIDRVFSGWKIYVKYGTDSYFEVGSSATRPSTDSVVGVKNVTVSINGESVWDSLKNLKEKFELNFYTSGRNIYIGSTNINLPNQFAYGQGNGLYQLERTTDSQQKTITRLYPRGNSRNMPLRFYQNLNVKMYAEFVSGDFYYGGRPAGTIHQGNLGFLLNDTLAKSLWTKFSTCSTFAFIKDLKRSMVRCMDTDNWCTSVTIKCNNIEDEVQCYLSDDPTGSVLFFTDVQADLYNAIIAGTNRIYFVEGGNRNYWDVAHLEAVGTTSVPNNVSIQNLMLPWFGRDKTFSEVIAQVYNATEYNTAKVALQNLGFETESSLLSRIASSNGWFIDSSNKSEIGIIEECVTFDGSVDGYDDIYPSLQYCGNNNTIVSADQITDNGIFDKETEIPNFHVVVSLDFDPSKYVPYGSSSFTMHMQTGYCGGRDFTVVGCKALGSNQYRLTLNRLNDSTLGLYFPYKVDGSDDAYQIKAGDKYVLLDIDMPDQYVIDTAVNALLPAAIKYLITNDYTAYKYSLKVNDVQMQRWCDAQAAAGQSTIHDVINAGCTLTFSDEALGIDQTITIDKLTIKEGDALLPKYEITLADEKTIGTIQRIQNKLDSIASSMFGSTDSGSVKGIDKRYMRTDTDTGTTGSVAIDGGLEVGKETNIKGNTFFGGNAGSKGFNTGLLGNGWRVNKEGDAEMHSLSLRSFLEVPELRYNRVSVHTGVQWQTFGGGIIEEVTKLTSTTGVIKLKLEDGEYGAVAANDLCMGIFHSNTASENADTSTDGRNGNFTFKGFATSYFKVTALCDSEGGTTTPDSRNQYFKYELRSGYTYHPQASMNFAAYANTSTASRQSCVYATTDYSVMLVNMSSWTYDGNNISMIQGNLSGFSIPADVYKDGQWTTEMKALSGHGIAFGKAYMWGNIEQFNRNQYIVSQQIYYYGTNDTQSSVTQQWESGTLTINDFSTDPIMPSDSAQYVYTLWKYTYSNGTTSTSTPACSAIKGSSSKGIDSVKGYFHRTTTEVAPAPPTLTSTKKAIANLNGWTEAVPASTDTEKYLWSVDIYKFTDGTMSVGTPYLTGVDGTNGTNGTDGKDGVDGAKGDKGDKGDQGIQGIQGEQGEKGDKGDQGIQGEKGEKGDTGATGAKGDSGIEGVVVRQCGEYDATKAYYNDSELTEPRTGENLRYLDIVQWKDANGDLKFYERLSYDSGSAGHNPETDGQRWQIANMQKFIATDVLMSDEAWINYLTGKSIYVVDKDGHVTAGMQSVDADTKPQIFAGASENDANQANFRVYKNGRVVLGNVDITSKDANNNNVRLVDGAIQIVDADGNVKTSLSQLSPSSIDDALPKSSTDSITTDTTSQTSSKDAGTAYVQNGKVTSSLAISKSLGSVTASYDGGMLIIPTLKFNLSLSCNNITSSGYQSAVSSLKTNVTLIVNGTAVQTKTGISITPSTSTTVQTTGYVLFDEYKVNAVKNETFTISARLDVDMSLTFGVQSGTQVNTPRYTATFTPSAAETIEVSYASYLNKILGNGFVFSSMANKYFAYVNNANGNVNDEVLKFAQGNYRMRVKNQMMQMSGDGSKYWNANPLIYSARLSVNGTTLSIMSDDYVLYNPKGIGYQSGTSAVSGKFVYNRDSTGKYTFRHDLVDDFKYSVTITPIVSSSSPSAMNAVLTQITRGVFSIAFYKGTTLADPIGFILNIYDGGYAY